MKNIDYSLTIIPFFLISFALISFLGCSNRPDLPASEYGKTVDTLPDLPNRLESFEFPDEAENSLPCFTKKRVLDEMKNDQKTKK
ncbi:MAG: hypothetical protein Q4G69_06385 [Planctomycetia bacterium]|nr:hypothetical protein [Planctomycetia bacterium]